MFSKKILGLVGLLFIGSQVSADINECLDRVKNADVVEGCVVEGSYCKVDKEIYNFGSIVVEQNEEDCKVKVTDEVLFFKNNGEKVGLGDITGAEDELKMYYCDSNSCALTKGYVNNNNGDFLIKSGKATSTNTKNTSCDGHVGELAVLNENEIHLCLAGGKTVRLDDNSEGSYLVSSSPSDDLNLDADNNKKHVITKKPNILLVNILYTTDNEPYCYDDSDASIMPRIDNYCEKENCNEYYVCNAGVCTLQMNVCPGGSQNTNPSPPPPTCDPTETESVNNCSNPGYYLGKDSKLYYCKGNNEECVDQSTTDGKGTTTHPTGYYVDAALSGNTNYIECTGGATCRTITVDEGSCSKDGLVYSNGGKINLCLDKEGIVGGSKSQISIILNGAGAVQGDYFIKVSTTGNIFKGGDIDGDKYTIVTVENGSVYTSEAAIDKKLFRYAGDNYMVLNKPTQSQERGITTRSQSVCAEVNDLYEFGNICSGSNGTGLYEYKDYRNRRQNGQSN